MDAVDQVLAQRVSRQAGARPWASLGAAALLHGAAVVIALLLPRFEKPPEPLQFVPVTVIPAQALGVERPLARPNPPEPKPAEAAAPTPAKPEPAPEPPQPKPSPKPKPEEREPPVDERPALPEPTAKPKPEPVKPEKPGKGEERGKKPLPAAAPSPPSQGRSGPGGIAQVGKGEEIGRRGSAAGSPLGTSGLGSQLAGVDPDFTYGYYLDRLLQLIDANWTRPPLGSGVKTILHFRIQKDGGIDELRVEESSGYNSFDLAALRAVQNAAPFPALPASYRHDSLGVSLIVR